MRSSAGGTGFTTESRRRGGGERAKGAMGPVDPWCWEEDTPCGRRWRAGPARRASSTLTLPSLREDISSPRVEREGSISEEEVDVLEEVFACGAVVAGDVGVEEEEVVEEGEEVGGVDDAVEVPIGACVLGGDFEDAAQEDGVLGAGGAALAAERTEFDKPLPLNQDRVFQQYTGSTRRVMVVRRRDFSIASAAQRH